jgi:transaldolase
LTIKLYSDGADFHGIIQSAEDSRITGFTTNPTLMKKAGVLDYERFARSVISYLCSKRPDTCLSLEVFADTQDEMIRQARTIDSWADEYKIYVKIPITNTTGEYTTRVIRTLIDEGININITAVTNEFQVEKILQAKHNSNTPIIISLFCGRIADAGVDPEGVVTRSQLMRHDYSDCTIDNIEFLWASPREVFNYVQADKSGCDIITMTPELIKKMDGFEKSLYAVSLDTVKMFYKDALTSGFTIND